MNKDVKEGGACGGEQGPWCQEHLTCLGQDLEGGQGKCQRKGNSKIDSLQ